MHPTPHSAGNAPVLTHTHTHALPRHTQVTKRRTYAQERMRHAALVLQAHGVPAAPMRLPFSYDRPSGGRPESSSPPRRLSNGVPRSPNPGFSGTSHDKASEDYWHAQCPGVAQATQRPLPSHYRTVMALNVDAGARDRVDRVVRLVQRQQPHVLALAEVNGWGSRGDGGAAKPVPNSSPHRRPNAAAPRLCLLRLRHGLCVLPHHARRRRLRLGHHGHHAHHRGLRGADSPRERRPPRSHWYAGPSPASFPGGGAHSGPPPLPIRGRALHCGPPQCAQRLQTRRGGGALAAGGATADAGRSAGCAAGRLGASSERGHYGLCRRLYDRRADLRLAQNTLSPLDAGCHAAEGLAAFLEGAAETTLHKKLTVPRGNGSELAYGPMQRLLDVGLVDAVVASSSPAPEAAKALEAADGAVHKQREAAVALQRVQRYESGAPLPAPREWRRCADDAAQWGATGLCQYCSAVATAPTRIHPDQVPQNVTVRRGRWRRHTARLTHSRDAGAAAAHGLRPGVADDAGCRVGAVLRLGVGRGCAGGVGPYGRGLPHAARAAVSRGEGGARARCARLGWDRGARRRPGARA